MSNQPEVIYLKDYQVPGYLVKSVSLEFQLHETHTRVKSQLAMAPNPKAAENQPVVLHGHPDVTLVSVRCEGESLTSSDYSRDGELLSLPAQSSDFVLDIEVDIDPAANTALEGLYQSDGMYCTQCEAEGFRRITFFPDRPDVMTSFTTIIEADAEKYPVLLSNGNLVSSEVLSSGRKRVTWVDPHLKPAYLFALVAGDLAKIEDTFVTMSGRKVALEIFAERKDLDKLDHAMASLKNAMKWDEEVYGREYDLDIYMIVAVDFFNMGAMENKGLNIFNTSCVLANPKTTTDTGFQRVEAVVAHEYFHNWSGNRVTCRDWFQLSLKEGFTVFRDAEFSADMNSRTVKRVEDVSLLRTAQFAEDAGPMSHPIRPDSFIEISNFYTLTVYEKGAEVVRMLHTLLGPEGFRKGTDLYFDRHDGQAVTTEDFVAALEDATGKDLTLFKRWYSQAGTPEITVSEAYDAANETYRLTIAQQTPVTPGQDQKLPVVIPFAMALIDAQGQALALEGANDEGTLVLEVTEAEQTFEFNGIKAQPVLSALRGFSAPVKLKLERDRDTLMFLAKHDQDGFAKWDAVQSLAVGVLQDLVAASQKGEALALDERLIEAYRAVLADESADPAMRALILALPTPAYLAELATEIDVDAIDAARTFAQETIGKALVDECLATYQALDWKGEYSPAAEHVAKRSLKNLCLSLACAAGSDKAIALASEQYQSANNMTDQMAGLSLLVKYGSQSQRDESLTSFYDQWQQESLVVNQWFMLQAAESKEGAIERVKALTEHPAFDAKNPNKLRAVLGGFCANNPVNFHKLDGSGYAFLADWIIELNHSNPQVASRMLTPLTRWKKYSAARQDLMKAELNRILAVEGLSTDVYEVVTKSLA